MSNQKEVESFLKQVKKHFKYEETGEGEYVSILSEPLLQLESIYLHATNHENKKSIDTNGLLTIFTNKDLGEGRVYLSKGFSGHIPERVNKVTVYVVDVSGMELDYPDDAPNNVRIFQNIDKNNLLGWFTYSQSPYRLIKTSLDGTDKDSLD